MGGQMHTLPPDDLARMADLLRSVGDDVIERPAGCRRTAARRSARLPQSIDRRLASPRQAACSRAPSPVCRGGRGHGAQGTPLPTLTGSAHDHPARRVLRDIPRAAIGLILLLAIAINFANIVGRYVFLAPLPWAEEVLGFLVIWGVALGASAVTYDRAPSRHGPVLGTLSAARSHASMRSQLVAWSAFAPSPAFKAWQIVAIMARNGQVSITAGIPMTIPYAAFVVGFGLHAVAAVAAAVGTLTLRVSLSQSFRPGAEDHAMLWLMLVLPLALMLLGLPFFLVLLATTTIAIVLFTSVPPTAMPQIMFGSVGNFRAAGGSVLHLRRGADGPRRHGAAAGLRGDCLVRRHSAAQCRSRRSARRRSTARSPGRPRRPSPRSGRCSIRSCARPATTRNSRPASSPAPAISTTSSRPRSR